MNKKIKLIILIAIIGLFSFVSVIQAQERLGDTQLEPKEKQEQDNKKLEEAEKAAAAAAKPKVESYSKPEKVPCPELTPEQKEELKKGLVQCGRVVTCYKTVGLDKEGKPVPGTETTTRAIDKDDMCKFNDVIKLINEIIKYILILAIPIVAIMFAYAGGVLVLSGGDAAAKTKAKGIFFNAVIGLVLVVGATLLVKTILTIVGYKDLGLFF